MRFVAAELHNVRNIADASIRPSPGINIFIGPNASGKTSLLEGLHLLCVGRSFRVRNPGKVVRVGADEMRVTGELEDTAIGACRLAMERRGGTTRYRLGRRAVANSSSLLRRFPVVCVRPENHSLISGGPKERRRFLDWSLFHVEHGYLDLWTAFHRLLRQRNRALQTGDRALATWDRRLAAYAVDLDARRQRYADAMWQAVRGQFSDLVPADISLDYYPGWRRGVEYEDLLAMERQSDSEQGFTRYGPHRADLIFRNAGREASQALSRGQAKLLITSVMLSQATLFVAKGAHPVLLLDDILSELDLTAQRRVIGALVASKLQSFVTGTGHESPFIELSNRSMFHVEHGRIEHVER